ncbi:MAG: M28 family peptidase [Actinomycetota bacterium]
MSRARTRRSIAAAAVLAGLIVSPAPGASAGHAGEPYFDLAGLPATDFTGKQIYDGLKQFVTDFPYRLTGTPNEIRAGLALHTEMEGLGYQVETCSLPTNAQVVCDSGGAGAGLKAIVATKRGTTRPDETIMFIGHYDTVPQTIYGAYDNGAGSNFIRFMAKELANVPTNRSLQFVWYNGEEEGLLASARHAQYLKNSNAKIAAVLGFDMVGIGFPVAQPLARNCMCMFHGADDAEIAQPLLSYVNYDFLGFPGKGVPTSRQARLVGNNTRNSDEQSFNQQGFFTLRWAGMRNAADYVAYHKPEDTIETINAEAGGETYYEQGVENFLKSVYYTTLALDNHLPVPAAAISTSGLSVSADASTSSDEDGQLSAFTWDFGDGTSGDGANAQHTYSAPGAYEITLTVGDNLWPQVTQSTTFKLEVA